MLCCLEKNISMSFKKFSYLDRKLDEDKLVQRSQDLSKHYLDRSTFSFGLLFQKYENKNCTWSCKNSRRDRGIITISYPFPNCRVCPIHLNTLPNRICLSLRNIVKKDKENNFGYPMHGIKAIKIKRSVKN